MSNQTLPKEELLRFVIDLDNYLTFDVNQKLPGRGAWLYPSKAIWQNSITKKPWKKALKVQTVNIKDDMESIIDSQLQFKSLQLISQLRSCGQCEGVFSKIEKQYYRRHLNKTNKNISNISMPSTEKIDLSLFQNIFWVLTACDAGADVLKRITNMTNNSFVVIPRLSSSEIGKIFNRDRTPCVLIFSGTLSRRLRTTLMCLELWRH